MNAAKAVTQSLVLGVHPTSRGFGWVTFENPFTVFEHGVCAPRGDKNHGCIRKFEKLLAHLRPEVLVMEAFDAESSNRSDRIRTLCLRFVAIAADQGVETVIFRRSQVQRIFSAVGAESRFQIADAVARHVPSLAPYLPSPRRPWEAEDKRLSVFSAAALVLTFYQNGAATFLTEMRNAA